MTILALINGQILQEILGNKLKIKNAYSSANSHIKFSHLDCLTRLFRPMLVLLLLTSGFSLLANAETRSNKKNKIGQTTSFEEIDESPNSSPAPSPIDKGAEENPTSPNQGFFTIHRWWLGAGLKTDYVGKVQITRDGEKNTWDPDLNLYAGITLARYWLIHPFIEIGGNLPGEGRDPNITRWVWYTTFGGFYDFIVAKHWSLGIKAGTGFAMTTVSGKGGEETLRNGNTTESFPLPNGSSTTRNVIAVLGLSGTYEERWRANFDFHRFNAFNERNAAWSYLFAINYVFDLDRPSKK